MFVLTTLVYPLVLALLCLGAALLVDRLSGGWLPAALLPAVGAAALIGVSQLSTYPAWLAPATPYLLAVIAVAGFVLGRGRALAVALTARARLPALLVCPIAYLLALAPVLLAGRPTFSSYMALADSAVHMLGADFILRHGQNYSHLDLSNSYGLFLHNYYGTSYPSGADTLFGGSSLLLGLPLIWTFQPFTAFMLATAAGPAWLLVRRVGIGGAAGAVGALTALATLTVILPALVYAYGLIGSVKEVSSLPMILGMGALVAEHRRWLGVGTRAAIPFALLVAAGVSALGVAFGAWVLVTTLVLCAVALAQLVSGEPTRSGSTPTLTPPRLAALVAFGVLVLLVAAWPTWRQLSGSLHVAQAIASTSNSGNLRSPLRWTQLFGVWMGGSYKLLPTGVALTLTTALIALVALFGLIGMGNLVRTGRYSLAGWFALMIVLWLVLDTYATTWASAKTLMLTSPVAILLAWAGIAALRGSRLRVAAPLAVALLVGGVAVSDALLYHSSNLAPTARYEELASINTRFAGRGPTLVTDFDEYALYELRDMDIGGPDFVYPPPMLAAAAGGYGDPVQLDKIAPSALLAYPLIVTRRDPSAARPPAAYRLLWQGTYYQVWGRRRGAQAALAHVGLTGSPRSQCEQLARVVAATRAGIAPRGQASVDGQARDSAARGRSEGGGTRLVVAMTPELVPVLLRRTAHPPGWHRVRTGIVMHGSGILRASFTLPHAGTWELWLQGDVMRAVDVAIDGRELGSVGGQLDGNSLVTNPLTPMRATLTAGRHMLTIVRPGANLAPGDGGAATLAAIFLTPAGPAGEPMLRSTPILHWRALCGRPLQWVEVAPAA